MPPASWTWQHHGRLPDVVGCVPAGSQPSYTRQTRQIASAIGVGYPAAVSQPSFEHRPLQCGLPLQIGTRPRRSGSLATSAEKIGRLRVSRSHIVHHATPAHQRPRPSASRV